MGVEFLRKLIQGHCITTANGFPKKSESLFFQCPRIRMSAANRAFTLSMQFGKLIAN